MDVRMEFDRMAVESLLHYHQAKSAIVKAGDKTYSLSEADVSALQQEGAQYYHRYLSLFQLRDFQNVIRDTERNLEMLDFVSEHATDEDSKWNLGTVSALRHDDEYESPGVLGVEGGQYGRGRQVDRSW